MRGYVDREKKMEQKGNKKKESIKVYTVCLGGKAVVGIWFLAVRKHTFRGKN